MRWRFLLFVLIAAALPPCAILLITQHQAVTGEEAFDQRLTAASAVLQARLDVEAAHRREMLLRIALLSEIAGPVHEAAEAGLAPPSRVVTKFQESIANLFPSEAADLVAVATAQGGVVLVTSGEQHGKTFSVKIADFGPAEAALQGKWSESFQTFQGALYRFSAAPVGVADAAIIVGDRIGDSATLRWRGTFRADVSVVANDKIVASSLKSEAREKVGAAAFKPNQVSRSGTLESVSIPFLKDHLPLFASHEAFRSMAKNAGGAYTIVTIRSDLGWIAKAQILGFGASLVVLVLGLIWSQVVYGPIIRQARSIEAHLARLRAERTARLTTRGFGVPFTAIAKELDELADHWSQAQPGSAPPPPPPRETGPTVFEAPRAALNLRSTELPLGPSVTPDLPEGTPAFPFADDPKVAIGRATRSGISAVRDVSATASSAEARSTGEIPPLRAVAGTRSDVKPAPMAAGTASGLRPVVPAPRAPANGTADTSIPPDLLARGSELEKEMMGNEGDSDDDHFRTIFDEFVEARRRCSEPVDGLTFDRFVVRLRKNRDQLIEKYACKSVRFQVYVKDGKAAVKALPVR